MTHADALAIVAELKSIAGILGFIFFGIVFHGIITSK